ncbi:hypothetical protein ACFQZZ_14945 [Nocardia sp. GCM10030253]|uniref:hypothetical protein n=1 Tax=Nocardia sp. GCM10030253 TaxID=3273404 RepID=UPI00362CA7EC
MSAPDRSQERARLEAELERLDLAHDVLSDIVLAVAEVSEAKGWRDNEFEMSRNQHVKDTSEEVHAERMVVFDRLRDIAAAERDRDLRRSSRQIERSR